MKKLNKENYDHLLKVNQDIRNKIANAYIEMADEERRMKNAHRIWRNELADEAAIARQIVVVCLSIDEMEYKNALAELEELSSSSSFRSWFKGDWRALFELVELNEANTGTDSETGEIPTETVSDSSNKGC